MGAADGVGSSWNFFLLSVVLISAAEGLEVSAGGARGRLLLGFRETLGNVSFQCSPSGPCIPCQYSEKNDEKYHCSETGYRLPLKCIEVHDGSKEEDTNKNQRKLLFQRGNVSGSVMQRQLVTAKSNLRKLTSDTSTEESGKQSYITYRSCVPVDGEDKLSVLGFELIMICLLLISGPVIYLRKKRPVLMASTGATRIPTNSPRF